MKAETESLYTEFRRLIPKVTGGLVRMRQEAYRDGVVPSKYKLLAALVTSIAIRCEPCIRAYVSLIRKQGITQEELLEFLDVAITMQGCPGEEWALKTYAMYKEHASIEQPDEAAICCTHSTELEGDAP
jgi:AhpD family alkylhydroperoxidase